MPAVAPNEVEAEAAAMEEAAPSTDRPGDGAATPSSEEPIADIVRHVLASLDDGCADPATVQKRELERCLRETLKQRGGMPGGHGGVSDLVRDQAHSELFDLGPVGDALADSTVVEIRLSGAERCEVVRAREVTPLDRAFASPRSYELVVGRLLEKASLSAPSGWLVEGDLGAGCGFAALASPSPTWPLGLTVALLAPAPRPFWRAA